MSMNVTINGELNLPGGGFNSSGGPVQGKRFVWGNINITSYTASGEPLVPGDVKLSNIDFITFDVRTVNDAGTVPAATVFPAAAYDQTSQLLLLQSDDDPATAVVTGENATVKFLAFGDTAATTSLL